MDVNLTVLLSIHKQHSDNILDGFKTLEIRKTAPQNVTYPYTIYMYETKGSGSGLVVGQFLCRGCIKTNVFALQGTSSNIEELAAQQYKEYIAERACLNIEDITEYANGGEIYALNVSDPIKYNYPLPLANFGITTPPQSWQYVVREK